MKPMPQTRLSKEAADYIYGASIVFRSCCNLLVISLKEHFMQISLNALMDGAFTPIASLVAIRAGYFFSAAVFDHIVACSQKNNALAAEFYFILHFSAPFSNFHGNSMSILFLPTMGMSESFIKTAARDSICPPIDSFLYHFRVYHFFLHHLTRGVLISPHPSHSSQESVYSVKKVQFSLLSLVQTYSPANPYLA